MDRPAGSSAPGRSDPELGDLLFETVFGDRGTGIKAGLAGLVLVPAGAAVMYLTMAGKSPLPCVGMVMAGIGVIFLGLFIHAMIYGPTHHRFYEKGVTRSSSRERVTLLYQDAGSMTYREKVGNGLADVSLSVESEEGVTPQVSIDWKKLVSPKRSGNEIYLDHVLIVRDLISEAIAASILEALRRGQSVKLNRKVQMEPGGIRLPASDMLIAYGSLDPELYEGDVAGDIELFVDNGKVLTIKPEDDNYWPAKLLLRRRNQLLELA